ncbi:NAD(P)H-dependent oxidoreductase [Jannaschia aquimarina]|uniref:AzoR_2 protein n=1 Tax=Jannaschia aquimarina TaxID=935700 RepID=A0A0D1EG98_9RHOB|nr:NAD(P)H-dependent oxidoreductase [Jannaschia aquimarina]KIT14850.1 FMN-dependent NADH-azoreductase [Jannaschia aquimarina]SNS57523.1 Putative NADPH-quinone reductase (modulator of drug activity B) [Jannaschia aquimarina]
MRALIVFSHPKEDSFSAAILTTVKERLEAAGVEYRIRDLYRSNFSPVLTAHELDIYLDEAANTEPVAQDVADLRWADTLIFVYPTWWYGLPAMLKGWLDRVLVPGVAFLMPKAEGEDIRPGLTNIKRLAIFTTCGASWWLTQVIGAPGKRTLTRGVRAICAKGCRTYYAAHHLMDSSTPETRARHLRAVAAKVDRMTA